MAKTLHNLYSSPKERDNYSNHKSFFAPNCKLWTKRMTDTPFLVLFPVRKYFFDMGNYHLWLSAEGEWGKKNNFVLIPKKKRIIFQELSWMSWMFFDKHELFTLLIIPRLPLRTREWMRRNTFGLSYDLYSKPKSEML